MVDINNEDNVLNTPKEPLDGNYVTWSLECTHCKAVFTYTKGDLYPKGCSYCGKSYGCDDAGSILVAGDTINFKLFDSNKDSLFDDNSMFYDHLLNQDGTPFKSEKTPEGKIVETELRDNKFYVTGFRDKNKEEIESDVLYSFLEIIDNILCKVENDYPESKKLIYEIRDKIESNLSLG